MEDNRIIPSVEYLNDVVPTAVHNATAVLPVGGGNFGGGLEHIYSSGNLSVMDIVQTFIVYAFIIVGALAAVFVFVGGVSFILSGGDDAKIKQAVNTIRYSIVGLIITILSFTFVTLIGKMFGMNLLEYISYSQIKNSIDRLIQTGQSPADSFNIQ
jgi:putative exporter of polyketide antibiotics